MTTPHENAHAYVVYGCRTPYAAEVAEIVLRAGGLVVAMIDNLGGERLSSPYGPVVATDDLPSGLLDADVLVPMLTPGFRQSAADEARSLGFRHFPGLVDPSAIVATTARSGTGSVVNAGVVIGAHTTLGDFVHVNRSASIAHDVTLADYVSIGPGVIGSGGVVVETGAFIGAGAVLAPNVRIGSNSIVGAGAIVVRDVAANSVVVGNPAAPIRTSIAGYGDVGVPT
ncbi:MAG TPA: hypothetical protein VHS03_16405 [Gaiellaceae bacterium]|nr:hypothetical protein [Gaiellaceae bacterium]